MPKISERVAYLDHSAHPKAHGSLRGSKYSEDSIEGHIALVAIKSFTTRSYKSATTSAPSLLVDAAILSQKANLYDNKTANFKLAGDFFMSRPSKTCFPTPNHRRLNCQLPNLLVGKLARIWKTSPQVCTKRFFPCRPGFDFQNQIKIQNFF